MNCPKCNSSNPDKALFCMCCGAKLDIPACTPANDIPAAPQAPENYPAYPVNLPAQAPPAQSFPVYGQQPGAYRQPQPPQYYGNAGSPPPPYNYTYGYRPGQDRDWAAITALVCGILSLPCCFTIYGGVLIAAASIVFGILGLKSSKKGMAIAGICLGSVGLLFTLVAVFGVIIQSFRYSNPYYYY